jgi:hypothetical protein
VQTHNMVLANKGNNVHVMMSRY